MKKREAALFAVVSVLLLIAIASLSAYAVVCPSPEEPPSEEPVTGPIEEPPVYEPFCGDGNADGGENCVNCPADVGACQPPDPCAIGDLDISKTCCEARGYTWVASGEERPFGGYEWEGQRGCAGDDAGEYVRSMECQGSGCTTNPNDKAACSNRYSCVLDGKCYTRLDKAVELGYAVGREVEGRSSESDDSAKATLDKMYELDIMQSIMLSNKMLKKIGGEMANALLAFKRETGRDTGRAGVIAGGAEEQQLLCLPRV